MSLLPRRVAILGLGLIGSSIARAISSFIPDTVIVGHDTSPLILSRAEALGLCSSYASSAGEAVSAADLVILCVPVGAMENLGREIRPFLSPDAIVSDVGSCKQRVAADLARALPGCKVIPAHPIAGTELNGPESGFSTLFRNRWCIVTPPHDASKVDIALVAAFWEAIGANVRVMDAGRHDSILATTSHLPHLVAFTLVTTAMTVESRTNEGILTYSAGGFKDITRVASSDPTMWRDIMLLNKSAILCALEAFTEHLRSLQTAIEVDAGDVIFDLFSAARVIRRSLDDQSNLTSSDLCSGISVEDIYVFPPGAGQVDEI